MNDIGKVNTTVNIKMPITVSIVKTKGFFGNAVSGITIKVMTDWANSAYKKPFKNLFGKTFLTAG